MAAIESRKGPDGKTVYRVKVRIKGAKPQTATFNRKTDARRWAEKVESDIREGRHFATNEAKRRTFAELADRYCERVLPHKKHGHQQATQMRRWRDELGHLSLANLSPAAIAEVRDKMRSEKVRGGKTRSAASVNRHLAVLSHALSVAVKEWGWLDDNPMRKVSRLKEPQGRVRFLSDDERIRLLTACKESESPDLYLAVVLSLATGARQAEIMELRWPQVDLKRCVITLEETKNGERRALPISEPALGMLKERAKVRQLHSDLVFPGRNPERPVYLRKPWLQALEEAGIKNFRWHDLRHSTASYLAMQGRSPGEIAAVLGHKTLQMVKRYAHLSQEHTASVLSDLSKRIF